MRENSYEVDADILMNPKVWEASGHLAGFSDPLLDCKECKTRHRADNLIQDYDGSVNADAMSQEEMITFIRDNRIPCPACGKSNFTDIRQFNLMFETKRGVTDESSSRIFLRPENAQGEYVNYLNVMRSMRAKLPFSIGQIGKAFRNEITPKNFTFRTVFCKPFLHKIAKCFCRLLHLHFVGDCKASTDSYSASRKTLQTLFNCYSTRYGNGSSEFSSSCACSLK